MGEERGLAWVPVLCSLAVCANTQRRGPVVTPAHAAGSLLICDVQTLWALPGSHQGPSVVICVKCFAFTERVDALFNESVL